MLAIAGLNQSYGSSHTLWDVTLTVAAGSRTCLMGLNGMGKTTLLKCVVGLLPASSGAIVFDGVDLRRLPADERARRGIGYVPQGREIFSQLTVDENLRLALAVRGGAPRTALPRIYDRFPVLAQMQRRRGGDLSGGQQQQLAIARALMLEPSLLILDEPTEGIQPNLVQQIGDLLLDLNREIGMTLLLVEQHLQFARRVATDFWLMEKGRTRTIDAPESYSETLIRTQAPADTGR